MPPVYREIVAASFCSPAANGEMMNRVLPVFSTRRENSASSDNKGIGQIRSIDRFIPDALVREICETDVRAPADVVFRVAENFDLLSIPAVYAIFRLRALFLRAKAPNREDMNGLVASTKSMGWTELARRPGRELVMGAAVQPWLPAPVFKGVAPDRFLDYSAPDHVKIVWTLEAEALSPMLSRFRTETRVQPTDAAARRKFRWYWVRAGFGIVLIRRLLLPAIRREAERRASVHPYGSSARVPRAIPRL